MVDDGHVKPGFLHFALKTAATKRTLKQEKHSPHVANIKERASVDRLEGETLENHLDNN